MLRSTDSKISRRQMLRMSGGALLAAGLWPGWVDGVEAPKSDDFTFIEVNDLHLFDHRCEPFFHKMVDQMNATKPAADFVLIVGDLVEDATAAQFDKIDAILKGLKIPLYVVIGNHDYDKKNNRDEYLRRYPKSLNYQFEHKGWRFVGLDSTEGRAASNTSIGKDTLGWLDTNLGKIDKKKPTVLFTHFPLGDWLPYRPNNFNDLLNPFKPLNLQWVFNGHFHCQTERHWNDIPLTTDRCCSYHRKNHIGTQEKGYFLCTAAKGKVTTQFVEVKIPGGPPADAH